jgi:hypothetical protein
MKTLEEINEEYQEIIHIIHSGAKEPARRSG